MRNLLLCLMYISTAYAQDPRVTLTDTDPGIGSSGYIIAERDTDVTLSCYVENLLAGSSVFWEKIDRNTGAKSPISEDLDLQDNISFGVEKPTTFTWRLRIRSVSFDDEGTYRCFVTTTLGRTVEKRVDIVVYAKPALVYSFTSTDVSILAGENLELQCRASGRPTPNIQWERQGNALLPYGRMRATNNYTFVISNTRAEDRGIYRCIASNTVGRTVQEVRVDVRFQPIVTPVYAKLKQKEGYVIELQCLVEANPYPRESELTWYKGSGGISQSTDRYHVQTIEGAFNRMIYELIIDGVTQSDYGEYRCQVGNSIGTSTAYITLEESSRPQNSVKLGRPISSASTLMSGKTAGFLLFSYYLTIHYLC